MPLAEIIVPESFVKIGLWTPSESVEEMLSALGTERRSYREQSEKLTSLKRRREFLGARLLLDHLTDEKKEIRYNDRGAPVLADDSAFISVSHTEGCIAVGINYRDKIGVDVEKLSEKAYRLRKRFLNERELALCEEYRIFPMAVLLWSAKESLFKILGKEEVDFQKHLHVECFGMSVAGGTFTARETRTPEQGVYRIIYRIYPTFVLTVCSRPEDEKGA